MNDSVRAGSSSPPMRLPRVAIMQDACDPAGQGIWGRLGREPCAVIAGTLLVVALVTFPQLPPGICYGDPGDFQLACATLGIMHPPGYAGYVSVGYLLTLLPGVDPAYVVSVAVLLTGLFAIALLMLLQIRLGVSVWIASATALAFSGHHRVWQNLLAPEVYMPSLALLAAATYLLVKYDRLGCRRHLFMAAGAYGFVLANRPPMLFVLPFVAVGWWLSRKRWDQSWRRSGVNLSLTAACVVAPGFYSLGYLWVRDQPATAYNYIENNAEQDGLPALQEGAQAKYRRVLWHASASQFREFMGNTWSGMCKKLKWVRYQMLPQQHPLLFWLMLPVVSLGAVVTFRRCPAGAWLVTGLWLIDLAFVCYYRVYGQAADLLPLLFSVVILLGVGLSVLLPRESGVIRRNIPVVAAAVAAFLTLTEASDRVPFGEQASAAEYLADADLGTLPQDAFICTIWPKTAPLWYAKTVLTPRPDIDLITTPKRFWLDRLKGIRDRPIFLVAPMRDLKGYSQTPVRNLWRLEAGSTGKRLHWHHSATAQEQWHTSSNRSSASANRPLFQASPKARPCLNSANASAGLPPP